MGQQQGVSVVVPAFNEEHNLRGVLEQLQAVLAAVPLPAEIILNEPCSIPVYSATVIDASCPSCSPSRVRISVTVAWS